MSQQYQNLKMLSKGHSLSYEILGIETPKKLSLPDLDYMVLISRQQQVIRQLQHQVKHLKQYIKYGAGGKQNQSEIETDSSLTNGETANKQQSQQKSGSEAKRQSGLKSLVKQVMAIVQAESIDQILQKLKTIVEKANRKIEPIFIERIKLKQVPVPVQVIKQVEKQVIVVQQKIVEVPIFRQKIVEKFIQLPPQGVNSPTAVNSAYSNKLAAFKEEQANQDFTKKKINFVQSPKHNQTYTLKSPKFKQKQEGSQKYFPSDKYSEYPKSPRYKQKDNS